MLEKSGQVEKIIPLSGIKGEKNIFLEKRQVALGEYGLFILGFSGKITESLEQELKTVCKKEQALFVQIETLCYDDDQKNIQSSNFEKKYYKKFITPYTAVIDITQTQEEILSQMKPKGRYNIKVANKKWVEVSIAEKTPENIEIFYNLMKQTTSRDGFSGNTLEYYKIFLEELENSELIFAKIDDTVVSAGIFVFEKEVGIYYYGASTSEKKYRNAMSPYALQWFAIQYAQEKWCKLYDFLGVASPWDENSSLAGVTSFKGKFTKDFRKVSDSYIFINKKWKYKIIEFLRKFKK